MGVDGVLRQGPSRRGVVTPEYAGRLAYTFVLHHEHCFRTALGHKWGAGVKILGPEQKQQPHRLPLLSDPGGWFKASLCHMGRSETRIYVR